jgi:hypothetical protein
MVAGYCHAGQLVPEAFQLRARNGEAKHSAAAGGVFSPDAAAFRFGNGTTAARETSCRHADSVPRNVRRNAMTLDLIVRGGTIVDGS